MSIFLISQSPDDYDQEDDNFLENGGARTVLQVERRFGSGAQKHYWASKWISDSSPPGWA